MKFNIVTDENDYEIDIMTVARESSYLVYKKARNNREPYVPTSKLGWGQTKTTEQRRSQLMAFEIATKLVYADMIKGAENGEG